MLENFIFYKLGLKFFNFTVLCVISVGLRNKIVNLKIMKFSDMLPIFKL